MYLLNIVNVFVKLTMSKVALMAVVRVLFNVLGNFDIVLWGVSLSFVSGLVMIWSRKMS